MSIVDHTDSIMDDYEAFGTFAKQRDPEGARRLLDEIRAKAKKIDGVSNVSLFTGLSFPADASEWETEEGSLRLLGGRLIEARASQQEYYGVACYGIAKSYEGFGNVVSHVAETVKRPEAAHAAQRFRDLMMRMLCEES